MESQYPTGTPGTGCESETKPLRPRATGFRPDLTILSCGRPGATDSQPSLLPHVHGDAARLIERHEDCGAEISKIRMTEQQLALANRCLKIADWRFADPLIVNPDLRPRNGINAEYSLRGG